MIHSVRMTYGVANIKVLAKTKTEWLEHPLLLMDFNYFMSFFFLLEIQAIKAVLIIYIFKFYQNCHTLANGELLIDFFVSFKLKNVNKYAIIVIYRIELKTAFRGYQIKNLSG